MASQTIRRLAAILIYIAAAGGTALAANVQLDGKIAVPQTAPLFAVSTDALVQSTLNQDFRGAHRGPETLKGDLVTVTVNVTSKLLKTGVVLGDLGGDPWTTARLLRDAGTEPPPLGDTGNQPMDVYGDAIRRQALNPSDPMAGLRNYQTFKGAMMRPEGPRFGPDGNASDEQIYDRVIIARASVSNSSDQMTALIVAHPGDDVDSAKELLAEQIANAILH